MCGIGNFVIHDGIHKNCHRIFCQNLKNHRLLNRVLFFNHSNYLLWRDLISICSKIHFFIHIYTGNNKEDPWTPCSSLSLGEEDVFYVTIYLRSNANAMSQYVSKHSEVLSRSCKRSGTLCKSLLFWLAGEVSWLAVEVLSPC